MAFGELKIGVLPPSLQNLIEKNRGLLYAQEPGSDLGFQRFSLGNTVMTGPRLSSWIHTDLHGNHSDEDEDSRTNRVFMKIP